MIKLLIILVFLSYVIADISKEEFVEKVNEIRLELAKKENIPNMHEMVWDDEIVSRIGSLTEKSKEYYELYLMGSYESTIRHIKTPSMHITRYSWYKTIDFLNPTQTHFGCVVIDNQLKCLLKPIVGMFEKEGEAGSNCNKGFENDGGLCRCVEGAKTTVETTLENSEFVETVNTFRLESAKQRNIANMHEMVWDNEIASRIEGMDENSEEYWQLEPIISYEDQIQRFKDVVRTASSYVRTVEFPFLNPTQTHFGCGIFYSTENDKYMKCLLKPRVGIFEKKGEPGSDCKEGFENHDGLCGRIITTTGISTLPPTTTSSTLKKENEKKQEETENNSSSFHLFVIFVLVLWMFY